jgi:hypothetical protein
VISGWPAIGLLCPERSTMLFAAMRPQGSLTELDEAFARFQAEIHRLALAAARTIVEQELARRRAALEPARARKARPAPPAKRQLELGFGQAPQRSPERQLALPLAPSAAPGAQRAEPVAEPPREAEPAGVADAAPAPAAPGPPAVGRGRVRWTRDSIISELATWMLSGTAIDAQFMTRHGPKGLVAASRRVFGRFEAALNLAALHNAKLYPEGPPVRGASAGLRAALAAPPREPK